MQISSSSLLWLSRSVDLLLPENVNIWSPVVASSLSSAVVSCPSVVWHWTDKRCTWIWRRKAGSGFSSLLPPSLAYPTEKEKQLSYSQGMNIIWGVSSKNLHPISLPSEKLGQRKVLPQLRASVLHYASYLFRYGHLLNSLLSSREFRTRELQWPTDFPTRSR